MISDCESGFLDLDFLVFRHQIIFKKEIKLIDTLAEKGHTIIKALFWFVFPVLVVILIKYFSSHGYDYTP